MTLSLSGRHLRNYSPNQECPAVHMNLLYLKGWREGLRAVVSENHTAVSVNFPPDLTVWAPLTVAGAHLCVVQRGVHALGLYVGMFRILQLAVQHACTSCCKLC